MKLPNLAEYRKAVVAALGLIAQAVASGVVSGAALHVAQVILGLAALAGLVRVENDKPAPTA
jgi:hypothetical protein